MCKRSPPGFFLLPEGGRQASLLSGSGQESSDAHSCMLQSLQGCAVHVGRVWAFSWCLRGFSLGTIFPPTHPKHAQQFDFMLQKAHRCACVSGWCVCVCVCVRCAVDHWPLSRVYSDGDCWGRWELCRGDGVQLWVMKTFRVTVQMSAVVVEKPGTVVVITPPTSASPGAGPDRNRALWFSWVTLHVILPHFCTFLPDCLSVFLMRPPVRSSVSQYVIDSAGTLGGGQEMTS